MIEVVGDASRGGKWALVRLRVKGERIVAAEAEGVDSAVALLRAGADAVGVTLRLWLDPRGPDAERACCSPEAVLAARATCHRLGLPHVTLDLREEFRRAVVESFVRGYARGETPNPCIRCNGSFRFAELLAFARRVGATRLATGHYARIVERDGTLLIARARDAAKDQSYMLARLDPRFLAGDDYRAFLERQGLQPVQGAIVDETGAGRGTHDGYWRFTPGQRRGLGVASTEPLYALGADARTNTVVVGPRSSLARRRVSARGRLFAT